MAGGRRRILVIEDDRETAEQLVDSLATSGYQVDLAVDGNDGLSRGRSAEYAVMTVDRMLPGIDGIAVIQRLREDGIVTPALIVSALGEIDDRVRGLRAGGDDYLVKPFAMAELLARVEALARRSDTVVKETVLRVGDLELDLVSRAVSRSFREIELLPREFQVLEYLVRNEGQVVPRAMLLQHVWDLHFDPTTNIIDVYVGRVRRKVDGQQAYPLIHTVRGVGYCVRGQYRRYGRKVQVSVLAACTLDRLLDRLIRIRRIDVADLHRRGCCGCARRGSHVDCPQAPGTNPWHSALLACRSTVSERTECQIGPKSFASRQHSVLHWRSPRPTRARARH
jgi:two-component system OmpR family response regulator